MNFEDSQALFNRAMLCVENFILPSNAMEILASIPDLSESPKRRLDNILFQVAIADHLRSYQAMYRDLNDEQYLAGELRYENSGVKLPVKHSFEKIVEGRSRAIALLKLGHGEKSVELLRGIIELATSYSLQGLWAQVEEKLARAQIIVDELGDDHVVSIAKRNDAMDAADRMLCVYRVLRFHVMKHNGYVKKSFIKELLTELSSLQTHHYEQPSNNESQITSLATCLHAFFVSNKLGQKKDLKQYAQSYFATNNSPNSPNSNKHHHENNETIIESKSWGEMIDYLREHCEVMRKWNETIEDFILPQIRASLYIPFMQCDRAHKNIINPMQLSQCLLRYPSIAKVIASTELAKQLSHYKTDIPLVVNIQTGVLVNNNHIEQAQQDHIQCQTIVYDLKITWEEFLSKYVIETSEINQYEVCKVQFYTLQGINYIYNDKLEQSESSFKKALTILERLGLEMTVVGCELYNSIAQMMIMKHRNWMSLKKSRMRVEIEEWFVTDEGQKEFRLQKKTIKKQYNFRSVPISTAEIEVRAKTIVMKHRMDYLMTIQEDVEEMNKTLEAAFRYLVRSFEILEDTHGGMHPAVATACLAVASVQNILEKYEDTREWLMRGLRFMEKIVPLPIRAITFTQTQLSQVLLKLGHDDEARRVLAKASSFHMNQAMQGVLAHNNKNNSGSLHQQNNSSMLSLNLPSSNQSVNENKQPNSARSALSNSNNNNNSNNDNHNVPITSRSAGGASEKSNDKGANVSSQQQSATTAQKLSFHTKMLADPIFKNSPLYEEIQLALELTGKAMKMSTKSGDKWQAALQAEEMAQITELAFGWDSPEAAESYKQVGVRCAAAADWSRACRFIRQSLETYELLYGRNDPRTVNVVKLLQNAKRSRNGGIPTITVTENNNIIINEDLDLSNNNNHDETAGLPTNDAIANDHDFKLRSEDFNILDDIEHFHNHYQNNSNYEYNYNNNHQQQHDENKVDHSRDLDNFNELLNQENLYGMDEYYPQSPLTTSAPSSPHKK